MQPFGVLISIIYERGKYSLEKTSSYKSQIIEKYFDMIYHLALTQVKNRENAEDIVQDVFLKYIQSNKDFESEEHIKAWLIRVTVNCSKSLFTSSWFKKTIPLEDEFVFNTEEKSDVFYAVLELPLKYRAVIHLFYYEDMSIAEISDILKVKPATVKSQLSRGREMLRQKLKGGCENAFEIV